MGNSPPIFDPAIEKQKLEINCYKIKGYLEINRDRRLNEAKAKEKVLLNSITSPDRSRQDEAEKARVIISGLNYVKACEILIRYSEILRTNSIIIIENRKDQQKIIDLIPFIENIIWSVKYMGIDNLLEFQQYILYLFGNEFLEAIEKSLRIDPELKSCFENLIATPQEINDYFADLAARYNLPLEKINEAGHEFAKGSPPKGYGGGHDNRGGGLNFNYNNNMVKTNDIITTNQTHTISNEYVFAENRKEDYPKLDDFEKRLKNLKE